MGIPQAQSIARPTRIRLGVLAFACILSLITYIDRVSISRAEHDIKGDLHFDEPQMGLIFAAFAVGYALFEVPGGWMGDVWGSRGVLSRIVIAWSIFMALTGCVWTFTLDSGLRIGMGAWSIPLLLDSLVLMILIRFLFGVGEAGAYPNLIRVITDWFPYRERGVAIGAVWMSARLGGAVAPLVLGRLAQTLGWRQAFWILGSLGVVWVVAFRLWFRDRPEQMPACNEAERDLIQAGKPNPPNVTQPGASISLPLGLKESAKATGHSWPSIRSLASSLTIWAMCSASFWVCFGWYFYPTWQPKYLKEAYDFNPTGWAVEVVSGLPFLCGALGCIVGGKLSDILIRTFGRRWGRNILGLVGFTGAGLCVLGTGYTTAPWQAVTLLCLAFLINDLAIPALWAACADVGGRYAGTVSGLMNMVGGGGAVLSPILIPRVRGWVPDNYSATDSWKVIFAGLAAAWFLAALSCLFIDASHRLEEHA